MLHWPVEIRGRKGQADSKGEVRIPRQDPTEDRGGHKDVWAWLQQRRKKSVSHQGANATIQKQDQFALLESNVEKNISPRNPRLIPCLNNMYSRLKLPVSFNAKQLEENWRKKKRAQHPTFGLSDNTHPTQPIQRHNRACCADHWHAVLQISLDSEKLGCVGCYSGKAKLQIFWKFTSWTRRWNRKLFISLKSSST